jgi:hypothetical protein
MGIVLPTTPRTDAKRPQETATAHAAVCSQSSKQVETGYFGLSLLALGWKPVREQRQRSRPSRLRALARDAEKGVFPIYDFRRAVRISDDMRRGGLAAFVVTVLALGGASCGGKEAAQKISAYHIKKGMTKKDVRSVAGAADRTTRRCWIYFATKPKPHPSRVRICFRHGRVSFNRIVVYG